MAEKLDIVPELNNLTKGIDWIEDTDVRRYLDAQITIIHRKLKDMPFEDLEKEASIYLAKMNE